MATNRISLKAPNGDSIIQTSKDMEEYFLKLGYTKVDGAVIKPKVFSNKAKYKINKEDKAFWLIDPIDGTRDYIKKKDEYTLNAALIINLKPAIGIVYAPEKNRLFFSYGKGLAFEINNGKKLVLNCKKINNKKEIT